jgi:hypothetical protein
VQLYLSVGEQSRKNCVPDVTAKGRPRAFRVMALAKYSLEIIQYVTVKNAAELGNASARSAVVQAKLKTSGRSQRDEIFPVQWLTVDRGQLWAD